MIPSRVNPRTVLLAALQEEPRTRQQLDSICLQEVFSIRWGFGNEEVLLDRHLCKLIRGGRVVRLDDGRYALLQR